MQLSKDRILTTHVGSLPRPPICWPYWRRASAARRSTTRPSRRVSRRRCADVVARQIAAGIDSVCDGEQSKISHTFYVRHVCPA